MLLEFDKKSAFNMKIGRLAGYEVIRVCQKLVATNENKISYETVFLMSR